MSLAHKWQQSELLSKPESYFKRNNVLEERDSYSQQHLKLRPKNDRHSIRQLPSSRLPAAELLRLRQALAVLQCLAHRHIIISQQ
jgi:hypothetical protein